MNPFENIYGSSFQNQWANYAAQNVRAAYAAMNASAYTGYGLGSAGLANAAAQPQGRPVDKKLADEMLIRRTGNICLQARAEGWKICRHIRKFIIIRDGKAVAGAPHPDDRQALINATEALAPHLGI